jgi:DNA repair exonuclease SbcCD nuclease subunit
MSQLFKKALVFTDIHFGLKSNSQQHNQDCEAFVQWAIDLAKEHDCDTGFFLGDWHHHRSSINLQTLNYSLRSLEKLNDAFENYYFIPGNHDLYYRDKRDIHGIEWAKHLPNIHICNDWFKKDNVAIVPWLVGDDYKKLVKIKSKYMFGHFELPHFKMNALVEMPDTGTVTSEQMANVERVFSGHFHMRQERGNVTYIGNAFPHNFTDAGDSERGCMILEWDGEPEFHTWPDQPLYKVVKLSTLLDDADSILGPNMHVKVNLDIDISYEEANFIKETFINKYGLREISLIATKDQEFENDNNEAISFNSVDTIISEQIAAIESDAFKIPLLMEIYNNL